jgi:hypothetical protein
MGEGIMEELKKEIEMLEAAYTGARAMNDLEAMERLQNALYILEYGFDKFLQELEIQGDITIPLEIEFVSFTGKYPNYCSGDLIVKLNGELVEFKRILRSGGRAGFPAGFNSPPSVEKGPWFVYEESVPEEFRKYIKKIEDLANEFIPFGCCGGCL